MKRFLIGNVGACILFMATAAAFADVKIDVGHVDSNDATADFKFKEVPSPAKTNAATTAKITIVDGDQDPNSGGPEVLNDGKLPGGQDEPGSNFFFNAGTDGGRILIDLGSAINIRQVNSYSWHSDTRAPQVYNLYAADGTEKGFNAKPTKDVDPTTAGWKLIAKVDTRPKTGDSGGQYGVSISDTKGNLGKFQYLLIAASKTESDDGFGNTFFSEINVIDANTPVVAPAPAVAAATAPAAVADTPVIKNPSFQADWKAASRDLNNIMPSAADLLDPPQRTVLAPKVLPILKAMVPLLADRAAAHPQFPNEVADDAIRVQACLSYLGDSDTIKDLAATALGDDKSAARRACLTQDLAAWWQANKDEKAQEIILGNMQQLAIAYPADGRTNYVLMTMKDIGAATPDISLQAEGIVANYLTSGDTEFNKAVYAGHVKEKSNMNKPVEFAGKTVDDADFSTTQYKGKVVLIDFWATWCHPCVEELPRVKAMYTKYHEQGLEIVGVSCDADGAKLVDFTKKDDMPWVQMWDKKAQSGPDSDNWHPLTKLWGIMSIPQMFLIDRNGNLRTVEARENMEEMIPKLLDEKVAAGPDPAATQTK